MIWTDEKEEKQLSIVELLVEYDGFIEDDVLYIYKKIPTNDFIRLRTLLRLERRITNIVVDAVRWIWGLMMKKRQINKIDAIVIIILFILMIVMLLEGN